MPQGGNTGLCGGATPDQSGKAIILSLGRMNTIRHLDTMSRPSLLRQAVFLKISSRRRRQKISISAQFRLPGTCQIGGNLSTNAGGLNVVRYGNTRSLCLGLEVVAADGRVMNLLSPLKKDNTGYDLKNLFIGAEGTLGIITAAVMQLFPKPHAVATALPVCVISTRPSPAQCLSGGEWRQCCHL